MLFKWLKKYEHIATWLQGIGVIAAIVFAGFQLRDTKMAIQASTEANAIALKARLSDLLLRINEVSIEHPEISAPFTVQQRLHLMRVEYFLEIFNLSKAGFVDDDRISVEEEYLKWVCSLPEFVSAWKIVEGHYSAEFRQWVEKAIKHSDALRIPS